MRFGPNEDQTRVLRILGHDPQEFAKVPTRNIAPFLEAAMHIENRLGIKKEKERKQIIQERGFQPGQKVTSRAYRKTGRIIQITDNWYLQIVNENGKDLREFPPSTFTICANQ